MTDEHPINHVVGFSPPSVAVGTDRAADVQKYYDARSPLARASLLPTLLLNAPPSTCAAMGLTQTRSGRRQQCQAARRCAASISRFGFAILDGGLPASLTAAAAVEAAALDFVPGGFIRDGKRLPPAGADAPTPTRTDVVCTLAASTAWRWPHMKEAIAMRRVRPSRRSPS